MKLDIDGLEVLFPYDYIYPEQYRYMFEMKRSLQAGGSCILEMPSGTGKTVSLLSVSIAYALKRPLEYSKIVYCSRTVSEIEKVLEELKALFEYYEKETGSSVQMTAICLTSRKNLCINDSVLEGNKTALNSGKLIDSKCLSLTASSTRAKSDESNIPHHSCMYYENFDIEGSEFVLPFGVYSIDELKESGSKKRFCPYFMARQAVSTCQILVYSYYYLLDPKIAQIVSRELPQNSIIIFDEAHNIDNVCVEAFSVSINNRQLNDCKKSLSFIMDRIAEIKAKDQKKLQDEYLRMLESIKQKVGDNKNDLYLTNPIVPEDMLEELIPGNIRKADHFLSFIKRFVEFLASKMKSKNVIVESPIQILKQLHEKMFIDHRPMRMCSERLRSLINTLEMDRFSEICSALSTVADFCTIVGTYQQGFAIITEPYEQSTPTLMNSKILLNCMDATLAIKPVFSRFKSVVITSGTLSPLYMYPKLLNFNPVIVKSLSMSLIRPSLCPLIITKGADQCEISSRFSDRHDVSITRNYGQLVIEICAVVPDGVVCFFTSYRHLESCMAAWEDMGILAKIQRHKLIFIETPNIVETTLALDSYRKACEIGRGGCFMSVARGKVSEGVDFHHCYGRAVIVIGVPYVYTQSYTLRSRLEYLREKYNINESDFLSFDAMRHTAQCLGRALRGKSDYGLMILADQRFARSDLVRRLPKWIQDYLPVQNIGLSTDEAVYIARRFLRHMGQTVDTSKQIGVSLLTNKIIESEKFQNAFKLSVLSDSNKNDSLWG